jgi:hypothetical protein
LRSHVRGFAGQVALVHGDSHNCRIDYPLWDADTQRYFPNFRRIQTFGSPRVNWLRVTADTPDGPLTVAPGRPDAPCCRRDSGAGPCR